jgi:hypothetical protein
MLYSNRIINPKLATYIREHTNKSLDKYLNTNGINSLQIDHSGCKCYIVPIVSLISFFAGYTFCYIKTIN